MQQKIQELAGAWESAFNANQIEQLKEFYTPQAHILPPGRPVIVGGEAAGIFFRGVRAQGFRDYKILIDECFDGGGAVIGTGRWVVTGPSPDGFERRYSGNWLICVSVSQDFKISIQMWN